MADDTSQKRADDLGHISPLLGTQTAQRAIDGLTLKIQKLGDGLDKATQFLDRISQKPGSGFGNTGTQSGGKPNGGGSTPGRPYDDIVLGGGGAGNGGGSGSPTTQGGGKPNGGVVRFGAGVATALIAGGRMNASTMISTNTTAQLLARNSSSPWQQIRSGFSRNNPTAVNSIDAAQGAANLQRLGYVPMSGQWNQAQRYVSNLALIDPTATATSASTGMADLASGRSWNFFASRGINTGTANGGGRNPMAIASDLLTHSGIGQGRRLTRTEVAQTMSQNGRFSIGLNQQVAAGNMSQDAASAIRTMVGAQLTAQQHGVSRSAFQHAVQTKDYGTLKRAGFDKNDMLNLRTAESKARNVEDSTASGFSKGLDAATVSLGKFNDMLDGLLKTTGAGGAIGAGQGFLGTVASGAGLGVGGLLIKGASKWALGKAGKKGASKAAEAAATKAAGRLGLKGLGKAAGPIGLGVDLGISAVTATQNSKGRDARATAIQKSTGAPGWLSSTEAWVSQFQSDETMGLSDWKSKHSNHWWEKALWGSSNTGIGGGAASGVGGGGSSLSGAQHDNGSRPKKKTDSHGTATAADAIAIAKRYLGVRYDWGGESPKGFDCSGLMQYVFRQLGINLPRTAAEQAKVGTPISLRDVRPGDLLFINQGGRVSHVAMSVGGGKIIEAPQPGGHVRIVNQYASLNMARRVLGAVGNVGGLGAPSESVSGDQRALGGMPALGGDLGNLSGVSGSEADIVSAALSTTLGMSFDQAEGQKGNDAAGAAGASGKPSGAMPKGNVSSWIKQALGYLHLPYNKYGSALNTIIQHESGGNPRAVNNWDSNAAAGHPSKGLMQTIDSTFNQYAANGHKDIWNPVDNIIAATKYALARYGSMDNVPGIRSLNNGGGYKGYDVGSTNIDVDQIAKVHKGEMVIPAAQAEAIRQQLATNTPLAGGRGGSGQVLLKFEKGSIALHASGPMNDSQATDFAKTIVRMISESAELKKIAEGVG